MLGAQRPNYLIKNFDNTSTVTWSQNDLEKTVDDLFSDEGWEDRLLKLFSFAPVHFHNEINKG